MVAYYNEIDPYAAQWLRNLISKGLIADGEVDTRSIIDVRPDDIKGFTQCHFFAGIGGWQLALRLAGWPDDRPVWTGSCPCQPFSVAGKAQAQKDARHLWPHWFKLITAIRPSVVFGEQVAGAIAHGWLDDAFDDLEREGYETGAAVLPACSVGAPHKRDRLWFVADASSRRFGEQKEREVQQSRRTEIKCASTDVADTNIKRLQTSTRAELEVFHCPSGEPQRCELSGGITAPWRNWKIEPGVGRVANGVPARVGRLRAYGNAIVPQVAAEFIKATM